MLSCLVLPLCLKTKKKTVSYTAHNLKVRPKDLTALWIPYSAWPGKQNEDF